MNVPHIWTNVEVDLLKQVYDTKTLSEVQKEYFPYLSYEQVRCKKRILGLKSTNKQHFWNCYKNENFFSKPNLTNSYWAGFIAADGNIYTSTTSRGAVRGLKIQLSSKDRSHLEKFKQDIEYTGNILDEAIKHTQLKHPQVQAMNGKTYYSSRLQFCNKQICKDLEINFNITPLKSLTIEPPTHLEFDHAIAFIKGYSDGDGCISIYQKRGKKQIGWSLVGTYNFLVWVRQVINQIFIVNNQWKSNPSLDRQCGKIYKIDFKYQKLIIPLLEYLRNVSTPQLQRKWDKIEEYKRLCEKQTTTKLALSKDQDAIIPQKKGYSGVVDVTPI